MTTARLQPEAAKVMRDAIREAGGVEVFAIGDVRDGEVSAVTVTCRGLHDQVLAILGRPKAGQVVLHNHPSGVLLPSPADMNLAGRYSENGVGFIIVDNDVQRSNWVVEPHDDRDVPLSEDEVLAFFHESLPQALPGFELRQEQVDMALAVTRSLSDKEPLAVEAGTGTGKSLAYLIPAALWALKNEKKVVLSTYTKALQTQLLHKDLPLLGKAGLEVRTALLMGRNNYLCKRRLRLAAAEAEDADKTAFSDLMAWDASTSTGARLDLTMDLPYELWEKVESDSDLTLRARCPHHDVCHYYQARRRAAAAQLVVVNHALLLADRANRESGGPGVLPAYERLILDEAHHLEAAATGAMSDRVTTTMIRRAVGPLLPRKRRAGALTRLLTDHTSKGGALPPEEHDRFAEHVHAAVEHLHLLQDELPDALAALSSRVLDASGTPVRIRHKDRGAPLWAEDVEPVALRVEQLLNGAVGALTSVLQPFEDIPLPPNRAQSVLDTRRGLRRLSAKANVVRHFLDDDRSTCRWVDRASRRDPAAALNHAPIEVAGPLQRMLWEALPGTVATSATLTVNQRFDHWLGRVGLEEPHAEVYPSPFDYRQQALLGLPRDLPEPNDPRFLPASTELIAEAIRRVGGGAFVLCTSYNAVRYYSDQLRRQLPASMPVLAQHGSGHAGLLQRFREARDAVLVGTDSFWEGVDVRGDALRLVIIPRLPFRMPTDPLLAARQDRLRERGLDPFTAFTLPEAIIKLRQGFGRLIRSRSDRGAVLLLDRRITSRRYGRIILHALPPARRSSGPARAVLQALDGGDAMWHNAGGRRL